MTLDDSLQLTDLGVSAFNSTNAATGKLGLFISAIESGAVKAGSYLLVESLDRLSRAEVMTALNQFTSILSKDISIVTLADNRVYTKGSINDIGNLVYSLMVMSRAHEESLTKSRRLSAAWENKRKKARVSGHKLTKTCPAWVELKSDVFHIIPDCVEIVKEIFQMALDGLGYVSIAKRLNLVQKKLLMLGEKLQTVGITLMWCVFLKIQPCLVSSRHTYTLMVNVFHKNQLSITFQKLLVSRIIMQFRLLLHLEGVRAVR